MSLFGRGRYDFADENAITPPGGTLTITGDLDLTGDLQLTAGGSVITTANGNFIILPHGTGTTIIGDAGSTSHSLATNDDLFVSGRLEVDGTAFFDAGVACSSTFSATDNTVGLRYVDFNDAHQVAFQSSFASESVRRAVHEEVTIPVAAGNTPVVVSSGNLAPANSVIKAVAVRVTQAPGGGATVVSVGRSGGGNTDEFIDDISTALGTTGNQVANSDGSLTYALMMNASADTFTVTTDADVTGSDMKIRIVVWYEQITVPSS